ncbi:hypothetical protein BDF22DRAFT_695679 [Syncephalis plumigaleata]|nr:hypothetical protein BDF22DRAFT_695679 [Syncephalis plumigaleata]
MTTLEKKITRNIVWLVFVCFMSLSLPVYQPVVEPFLYTFNSLVETLADSYYYAVTTIAEEGGPSVAALTRIHQVTDPYFITSIASIGLMVLCWLVSTITDHYSLIDRLCYATLSSTLAPPTLILSDIYDSLWVNPRLTLITLLVTLWGARLTFNYWRKGGYTWGEEDYRWRVVKADMHPLAFQLMGFVSWSWMDIVATTIFVMALIGETVADEQQWRFHQRKHDYETPEKRYRRRSNDPVVVVDADIPIWVAVYMFGTAVTGEWCRWDSAAVITLILLFQGSTSLTERITAEKYPAYVSYHVQQAD